MKKFKRTFKILKKMDPNTELVGINAEKAEEAKFKRGEYYKKSPSKNKNKQSKSN